MRPGCGKGSRELAYAVEVRVGWDVVAPVLVNDSYRGHLFSVSVKEGVVCDSPCTSSE